MSHLIRLETTKTYATEANAVKAFEKIFGNDEIRYIILRTEDGRFFPAALGQSAIQAGVHFHFHVLG
jgi:hypothetical protein